MLKTFFLFLVLLQLNSINLCANEKTYKIAITADMKPYAYLDKDKKVKGILVDYWKLWAKKSSLRIKFVPLTWNNTIEAIKNNKVDIHSGLFKNKIREKSITYLKKLFNTKSYIYIFKEDKYTYTSMNDLDHSSIGLIKGSFYEEYLKRNYPNILIKTFNEYKDLNKAIQNKDVDTFIGTSLISWMNIRRYFDYNAVEELKNFKLTNWLHPAVNKDNLKLKDLVLAGMNKISKKELLDIEDKWISKSEFRYLSNSKEEPILSEEEHNYLNTKNTIEIATLSNTKNFSSFNDKKELVGLHVDLIKTINQNVGTRIKLKPYDTWVDAYEASKSGLVDGIFYLSWLKQREKFFNYSPAYHFSPFKIVVHKDNFAVKDVKDFKFKKIASLKNSILESAIKRISPSSTVINYSSRSNILKALQRKEVDATLVSLASTSEIKKYDLKEVSEIYIKEGNLYIGITKDKTLISSIVNKGIKSISKKQIDKLNNKWFKKEKTNLFTKEEISYIKNAKKLIVGVDFWEPIEFSKNGESFDGISGDIFKRISELSGLEFKVYNNKWHILLEKFKNKEIDVLPAVVQNQQRDKFSLFTQKYLINKSSLFIESNNTSIKSFKDLKNKKLAIEKGYASIQIIKEKFPEIEIIETNTLNESIKMLINKQVSALFALEINTNIVINEFLISNIKVLHQNEIKSLDIKIASRKNDLLLNSILKKSLYAISSIEKNQIIEKWLYQEKINKSLHIALKLGREPFVLDKTYLKGIEYDLIKIILEKSNIKINSSTNMSLKNLHKNLKQNKYFDILVNVKEQNKNYYYSNNLITFQNVAISRKSDDLIINQIKDLENKNIIAFEGASKFLQKEYTDLFTLKTENYKEEILHEKQVKDFLNKKSEVIILDKNIFKWFLKKYSNKSISEYKFDFIFAPNNSFKLAFKDERIRDIFNINLKKIKEEGKYQEIFDNYLESNILQKVKINTLISTLLSKYIFNKNIKELKEVLKVLSSMTYIDKIEVYSNKLLSASNSNIFTKYMKHDIYYNAFNIPQKVGYIKVYYNDIKIKEAEDNLHLVPNIKNFEKLKSYAYITKIYKQFDYLKKELLFTKKEKEFLEKNTIIKFSSRNWEPLSIIENNKYNGLISDYMKIIEEKTSLKFKLVKINTWDKILSAFKNKEIDFLPSVANTKEYKDLGLISNKYEDFNYSIVTNKEGSFINKIKDLENRTLAIPTFYTPYKYIKEKYPNIKVVGTKNIKEALALVSTNKVHAFIGHEATSVFYIKKFFPDLKIAGLSSKKFEHHFLISKDKKILLGIINKVLSSISYEQKLNIRDKWIKKKINLAVDYSIIYQIIFVFLIILLIVFYFIQKINNAKKKIQEQKESFEKLFNDASDGLLLMRGLKFFECNNAALKLLKYKQKNDLLDLVEEELSPALQPDGENSKKKRRSVMKECNTNGSTNFEWVHIKSTGEHCWLDVTLTKIVLNNENITHVVWRDINNKKLLQQQIKRRNEELEDSNEELETTINNLKQAQEQLIDAEKMASLGGLVAGVAHEINTPVGIGLTGITHLEELSKDILEKYDKQVMSQEEFEEYLHTSKDLHTLIHSNLKKAAALVKSFKQVAVDQSSEEMRSFNINDYMKEILSSIHSITKKTKINIKYTCDKKIEVNSYPGAYSQIITNLIMNSIIHGFKEKQEGDIFIQVVQENKNILIYYKDSGVGIKKDNINKIFDPFFTTNRENGGSGLGLNIIYNLITSKLKGSISCKSDEGKGVEFNIVLEMDKGEK